MAQDTKAGLNMNWRLGLFTEMLSNQAMGLIYQVLKSSGFEWKVKTPYHIITKKIVEEKTDEQMDAEHPPTRIGIQLYRMHDRHDKGYAPFLFESREGGLTTHIHDMQRREVLSSN